MNEPTNPLATKPIAETLRLIGPAVRSMYRGDDAERIMSDLRAALTAQEAAPPQPTREPVFLGESAQVPRREPWPTEDDWRFVYGAGWEACERMWDQARARDGFEEGFRKALAKVDSPCPHGSIKTSLCDYCDSERRGLSHPHRITSPSEPQQEGDCLACGERDSEEGKTYCYQCRVSVEMEQDHLAQQQKEVEG